VFSNISPSSDSNGNKFGELGYQVNRKSGWRLSGYQVIRVSGYQGSRVAGYQVISISGDQEIRVKVIRTAEY